MTGLGFTSWGFLSAAISMKPFASIKINILLTLSEVEVPKKVQGEREEHKNSI